jgi:glucose dehydrogenase
VRAYDAHTGQLRWKWDPIPQDPADPARTTWEGDSSTRTGAANVWAVLSADPGRDLVFVPTSSPSPDFYGGERRGSNFYANAVVALRASTGKVVWVFQVVHHDLWDYDVASQPMLVTVMRDGRDIPAVAEGTMMGHLFLLHRETGQPLFPAEERRVSTSTMPGEAAWPTQPFPTLPPPLVPQTLTPDDAWGFTPLDRRWCRKRIQALRAEGIFAPPNLEGTIVSPGFNGAMHWGGPSYEPARGLLIVNTNRWAHMVKLIPREDYETFRSSPEGRRLKGGFAPHWGTPLERETPREPSGHAYDVSAERTGQAVRGHRRRRPRPNENQAGRLRRRLRAAVKRATASLGIPHGFAGCRIARNHERRYPDKRTRPCKPTLPISRPALNRPPPSAISQCPPVQCTVG